MTLLPCILDKTRIFLDQLDRFVETGEEFQMDYYATGLTFDIIGALLTLGHSAAFVNGNADYSKVPW